jgi:hypothetical protein
LPFLDLSECLRRLEKEKRSRETDSCTVFCSRLFFSSSR